MTWSLIQWFVYANKLMTRNWCLVLFLMQTKEKPIQKCGNGLSTLIKSVEVLLKSEHLNITVFKWKITVFKWKRNSCAGLIDCEDKASGFCGLSVRAVVHSFKQQDGFTMHGLGEEVNSHSSHWTERGSSHTVRNSSAETKTEIYRLE